MLVCEFDVFWQYSSVVFELYSSSFLVLFLWHSSTILVAFKQLGEYFGWPHTLVEGVGVWIAKTKSACFIMVMLGSNTISLNCSNGVSIGCKGNEWVVLLWNSWGAMGCHTVSCFTIPNHSTNTPRLFTTPTISLKKTPTTLKHSQPISLSQFFTKPNYFTKPTVSLTPTIR